MKKYIASTLVALFSAALLAGCHASADVDSTDADAGHTSYHKTTIQHPNGETTVKTEKSTSNY